MAQALEDIIKELDASYAPSRQLINQQIDAIPTQADAQVAGLNSQKDQAFNDITDGARSRGIGFSGIPLAEQAKYTSSEFLPAVAKVRQAATDQKTSLLDALNKSSQEQRGQAYSVRESQLNRDQQAAQFAQEQAAARARAAGTASPLGALFGGSDASLSLPKLPQPEAPKFLGNNDLRGHLNYLAQKEGNRDAQVALQYVGNDGKFNLNPKTTSPRLLQILTNLGATNVFRG